MAFDEFVKMRFNTGTYRLFYLLLFLYAGMIFSGCFPAEINKSFSYPDMDKIMKTEIDEWGTLDGKMQKTLTGPEGGGTLEVDVKEIKWKLELGIFRELNIAKPAYAGLYEVDSTVTDSLKTVRYKAMRDKFPVRSLELHYAGKRLVSLSGELVKTNYLFHSVYTLDYVPMQQYLIRSEQTNRISGNVKNYIVTGKLLP